MKCPICGKELELKNKQIGTNENGDPIFNEYAICRDCRKQWNLDKQRAKKAAAKASAPAKDTAPKTGAASKTTPVPNVKKAAQKTEDRKTAASKSGTAAKSVFRADAASESVSAAPAKRPVKKRSAENMPADDLEEKRYSNIPPEKVRTKREKAARQSYEDMLATGTIGKPVKKKRSLEDEEDRAASNSASSTPASRKNTSAKPATKKPEPEYDDDYDDDDYYEDTPRFRVMRVILGILSLLGFGYFAYRGFTTGLSSTTDNGVAGMTFIILALCLLVSALLYFIMIRTNSVFAFLLPMIFYLGSAVFAFLRKGDDLQLFVAAVVAAVLAVVSLILAITSRGGDDYDDYDDAFEDDYADE